MPHPPPNVPLGDSGGDAMTAYEKRRQSRQGKEKKGQEKFLSSALEIDADVSIRFDFTVVGADALRMCQSACASTTAARLEARSPTSPTSQRLRCFCEVDTGKPGDSVVARLAFNVVDFNQELPSCNTRQEAFSSAIVFCLDISLKDSLGEPAFKQQLERLQDTIRMLRETTRRSLRPVKALLLYDSSGNARPSSGLEAWALQLADFEQEHGDHWKFGPALVQDADGLHHIFQEITTVRVIKSIGDPEEERIEEEAAHEEGEGVQVPFLIQSAPLRSPSMSSGISMGHVPPQYSAEMSGSECSESALEMQRRMAGV